MGDPWLLENSDVSAPDACAVSVLGAGHVTIRLCVLGGGKSRQIARFGVRVGGGGKGLLRGSAVVKCKVGVLCTDQASAAHKNADSVRLGRAGALSRAAAYRTTATA
eukprot:3202661-Rhodomonas_salina.3